MSDLSLDDLRELASFDAVLTDEEMYSADRLEPGRGQQHRLVLAIMSRSGEQLRDGFGKADGLPALEEMLEAIENYTEWLKVAAEIAEKAKLRLMAVGAYAEAMQQQKH